MDRPTDRPASNGPVFATIPTKYLAFVAALVVGVCLLAGPADLLAIGGLLLLMVPVVGFTMIRLTLAVRLCELAQNPGDLLRSPTGTSTPVPGLMPGHPSPGNYLEAAASAGTGRHAGGSFWDALGDTERRALRRLAVERRFAHGTEIFREGDQADHVLVIREGRTRVCLRRADGNERVLARRGPGQLVGERGALEVKVRSATVVAEGPVRAWVVRTHDFATFIGANPRVLDIVEHQVYWRLTEPSSAGPIIPGSEQAGLWPEEHQSLQPRLDGDICSILLGDIVSFSGTERTDDDRRFIRQTLTDSVRQSFAESHIPVRLCHWEDRGDGFLIVVPPNAATTSQVLEGVPHRLAIKLRRHNRRCQAAGRIQLRLAVHVGPVVRDQSGVSGDAIIHAARLVEAPVFKRAVVQRAACLGLIVSAYLYDTLVRSAVAAVEACEYERITCKVKESRIIGWVSFR